MPPQNFLDNLIANFTNATGDEHTNTDISDDAGSVSAGHAKSAVDLSLTRADDSRGVERALLEAGLGRYGTELNAFLRARARARLHVRALAISRPYHVTCIPLTKSFSPQLALGGRLSTYHTRP